VNISKAEIFKDYARYLVAVMLSLFMMKWVAAIKKEQI
jgi:hypothetical protein